MGFREELQTLVEAVPGAGGAAVMGVDGIPIDTFIKDPQANMELLGAEYAMVYRDIQRAAQDFKISTLSKITVKTRKETILLSGLTQDYFLVLQLAAGALGGRANFLLQRFLPRLQSEL